MNTKSKTALLSTVVFLVASLTAVDGYTAKIVWVSMGESRCERLLMSGKPARGGYQIERIWAQRPGIVNYFPDEDKGLICFEPQRVGSTKIRVRGQKYELNRYGKKKSSEKFYRAFEVRVRP
jgi:hypothetical protein